MAGTIDSITIKAHLNARRIHEAALSLLECEGLDESWIDNLEALVCRARRINQEHIMLLDEQNHRQSLESDSSDRRLK